MALGSTCCWLALASLLVHSSIAVDISTHFLERRQAQLAGVPSVSSFISRAYQSSTVLGNYIYIDGGEIAFYGTNGQYNHLPDNNTYSIDLTRSWTNSSVTFTTIQKSAPVMNYVALWPDESSAEVFAFGGEQSAALPKALSPAVSPTSLWKFTPNGASGQWSEVNTSQGLDSITRPAAAIGASSADAGYLLGGYITGRTSAETVHNTGFQPVPGILQFNFTTQTWSNHSSLGFSTYGTAQYGQGHVITGFGDHSVVAFFGGETSDAVAWHDNGANLLAFDTIYIYDPQEDKWYSQPTSGTTPEPRDRFCSVGLPSNDGSYEIFIFGGHVASPTSEPQSSSSDSQKARNLALDEVFSLSLPSFNWQKANYTANWPRVDHSCNIIGKRQMIVIGGLNPASSPKDLLNTVDPWTNGIGVFDLSEMQWTNGYNASADNYTSPQAVKDWYRQNGRFPAKWGDSALETYFRQTSLKNSSTSNSNNSSGSGSGSSSSSSSSDGNSAGTNSAKKSSKNAGAIAGGVVGGLAVLTLAGLLFWFLRRRMANRPTAAPNEYANHDNANADIKDDQTYATQESLAQPPNSVPSINTHELGTESSFATKSDNVKRPNVVGPPVEAPAHHGRHEMAG